jgi:hypothetical protein
MNVPKTIFCDIDGTILKHTGDIVKNYTCSSETLPNVIETFKSWDKNNFKIILITGRKESTRKYTEEQLGRLGIVYDELIMGLPNGDRVIINDKKPRHPRNTAYSINVVRNKGFENLDLISTNVTVLQHSETIQSDIALKTCVENIKTELGNLHAMLSTQV